MITYPEDGAKLRIHDIAIAGTGQPGALLRVTLENGTPAGSTIVGKDGTWQLDPVTLADGEHSSLAVETVPPAPRKAPVPALFRAPVSFGAPQVAAPGEPHWDSPIVGFTIDSVAPPAPEIVTPTNGSAIDSGTAISGDSEPDATITVIIDGATAGTATADGNGDWSFIVPGIIDGKHTAEAIATDGAGNVSPHSNKVAFTVHGKVRNGTGILPITGSDLSGLLAISLAGAGALAVGLFGRRLRRQ